MAIRTVVTRGFGNGTFSGTISLVVTRGYSTVAASAPGSPSGQWTATARPAAWTPETRGTAWAALSRPSGWTFDGDNR